MSHSCRNGEREDVHRADRTCRVLLPGDFSARLSGMIITSLSMINAEFLFEGTVI
jgi:hypothetical protein